MIIINMLIITLSIIEYNSVIVILLFAGNIKQIQLIINAGWEQV